MGRLFIITGPSGAGKREVISRISQFGLKFLKVVTYTTREKRQGETESKSYNFVSKGDFEQAARKGEFLEWSEVHGNLYGSKKEDTDKALKTNGIVLIETDPAGARQIKKQRPAVTTIFVMPPSYEDLKKRLTTLTDKEIKTRIEIGKKELEKLLDWDYLVVYEDGKLDRAAEDMIRIIKENL